MPASKRGAKRKKRNLRRVNRMEVMVPVRASYDEHAAWRKLAKSKDSDVSTLIRESMNRRVARAK